MLIHAVYKRAVEIEQKRPRSMRFVLCVVDNIVFVTAANWSGQKLNQLITTPIYDGYGANLGPALR